MTDPQQRTLERFQGLLEINGMAHVLRAAREVGIFDALQSGQKTLTEIAEICRLRSRPTRLILDCLVALEVVEHYEEDYALAPVAQLLGQQDRDLRDEQWSRLVGVLKADESYPVAENDPRAGLAASQWVHTAAAMQVASVLNIGTEHRGWQLLDLGCGAGVWSSAMAYRDPSLTVTAIDRPAALELARQTAESINLLDRWKGITSDPFEANLAPQAFDAAILGGWLHAVGEEEILEITEKVRGALRPNGLLIVPDLYHHDVAEGGKLTRALEALRIEITTQLGRLRRPAIMLQLLQQVGFGSCQFAPLSASRQQYGLLVATRV